MPFGINPEKRWVRPSSSGTGGTTKVPTKNIKRPGAGGARTGGITDRVMKAKPYKSLERYKGKDQITRERLERPKEMPRRRAPMPISPRPMPGMGMITTPQMPAIQIDPTTGQPVQPVMGQPMQPGMPQPGIPPMMGAPMQPQSMPAPQPMPGMFGQLGQRFGGMLQGQYPMRSIMPMSMPTTPSPMQSYNMPQYRRY